ncbi:MAG: GNAT family N-acetyltransferase [Actinomycetia bacterium]|nr:GNAT family N-acetyltransferase [Actinomycetes bacterium]
MIINKGLPGKFKDSAADLFLNALGEKFIPILGEKNKAKEAIELSINQDNCFSAENESKLLGFLAFQINETSFLNPSLAILISVYGLFSGILKAIGLSMLEYKTNSNEIHIEAIAVDESARGKGIGTKLLDAIFQLASEKRYKTITLEVIDINPRARELYERIGFEVVKQSRIWPLNKLIGWPFNKVFLMKKEISLK